MYKIRIRIFTIDDVQLTGMASVFTGHECGQHICHMSYKLIRHEPDV